MRSVSLLLLSVAVLGTMACRPSNDRVAATESGAVATSGQATPKRSGDPVAKGAEKATPETLPANLVLAPADRAAEEGDATNSTGSTAEEDSNDAEPARAIPAAFHGRWGMVPADCTSTRGDAKGLITIGPESIRFYESIARLTDVTGDFPENFTGEFAFAGEGQEWTRTENLKLTGSSNTLVRSEDEPKGSYTYTRCR
jgi:hypothetical protein